MTTGALPGSRGARLALRAPSPALEAALVAAVVAAVHLVASLSPAFFVGALSDDGVYTVLGRALAEGHGWHSMHLIGAPVQVKYPPGFPALLSALWLLAGSLRGLQRIIGVLHPCVIGVSAGMLWWLGRARLGVPRSLLALGVCLPLLLESSIEYYSIILSEPWLILGWAGTLLLWSVVERSEPGTGRLTALSLTGGLIALTTLFRNQAVVLIPAFGVALFAGRYTGRERLAALAACLGPLLAWQWYLHGLISRGPVSSLPDEGPYVDWIATGGSGLLRAAVTVIASNATSYLNQFAPYVTGVRWLGLTLVALLFTGLIFGTVAVIRRQPLLSLSALGGAALVLVWPFAQDRLLLPVLPFLGLASGAAIAPRLSAWPPRRGVLLVVASVAALTLMMIRQVEVRREAISAVVERRAPRIFTPGFVLLLNSRFIVHASAWIRAHTGSTDHVMVDNNAGIYLYSGRPTVPASPSESRLRPSVFARPGHYLASRILSDSVQWILIGVPNPGILRDIDTVAARCPSVLSWAGNSQNDARHLYRVVPDTACLGLLARPSGG
jgi:hypothetical protein